jgi:hypothetical protein
VRPLFSILKTLTDGSLHLVEGAETLESARERVDELAKVWPGKYVILNRATGERLSITAGGETRIQ